MSDETHPDSPSGQPYSAPTGGAQPSTFIGYQRETTPPTETPPPRPELDFPPPTYFGQAWGGNADSRNLSYEGLRYFGRGQVCSVCGGLYCGGGCEEAEMRAAADPDPDWPNDYSVEGDR